MRRAFAGAVLLLAGLGWAGHCATTPITHGIDRSAFRDPERAAEPVESFVRRGHGEAPRPNLVVILADDLGYGDVGVQGSGAIDTPHIDRLAAEGLRLTEFYASAPVCSPSRAGLLTGRYPLRSGIVAALQAADDTLLRRITYQAGIAFAKLGAVDLAGGANAVPGLPPSEVTLAEALRVGGYRTMAVGKWHLGDFTELPQYHPANQGFDHFVGFNMSNDDWPVAFWRDHEEVVEDIGLDQARYTRVFTEAAVEFVEDAAGGEPFFLYLAHKDPHQPFFPSEAFAGRSAAGPYGDAVAEFDWSVGQVVDALRRTGVAEDTLVVVTSDNGPWFEGSPGGLRGRKGQSYEGGFRVPFVAWWPGRLPAGSVSDVPTMNIDLFPTFLGLAGLEGPTDRIVDGRDQWAAWADGSQPEERALYFFHDYDVEALRVGDWKLIERNSHYVWPAPLDKTDTPGGRLLTGRDYQPPGSAESVPTLGAWPLLYHLERDLEEAYNVAASHPARVRELRAQLEAWRRAFAENPRGWR